MRESVGWPVFGLDYFCEEGKDSGYLVVAGGGGPSKSGVGNGILVYAVRGTEWKQVTSLSTKTEAVMNCAIIIATNRRLGVVAGVNDRCWLLEFNRKQPKLSLLHAMRTDHSSDEDGYQRALRVKQDNFITVGVDGQIRTWTWPRGKEAKHYELKDCLDADFVGDGDLVAAVSPSELVIFDAGVQIAAEPGYQFRLIRSINNLEFLSVENSTQRLGVLLRLWNAANGQLIKSRKHAHLKGLSCLHVAGDTIAYGCSDGTVGIFDHDLNVKGNVDTFLDSLAESFNV